MKTYYRFFCVDGTGHIIKATAGEHDDDLQALDHARSLANGYAIEVWTGTRRIALVRDGDAQLNVRDNSSL